SRPRVPALEPDLPDATVAGIPVVLDTHRVDAAVGAGLQELEPDVPFPALPLVLRHLGVEAGAVHADDVVGELLPAVGGVGHGQGTVALVLDRLAAFRLFAALSPVDLVEEEDADVALPGELFHGPTDLPDPLGFRHPARGEELQEVDRQERRPLPALRYVLVDH